MRLFIQLKNGQPFEHPIFEDNFRAAFPHIDVDNLPPAFAEFVRVAAPQPGVYEVYEGATYEQINGVFTDVHHIRPMTDEEKQTKIAAAEALRPGPNWTLDLDTLRWKAPAMPTTGGPWKFDGVVAKDWVIATEPPFPSWTLREDGLVYIPPVPRPQDGKPYRWDEPTLSWVPLNV